MKRLVSAVVCLFLSTACGGGSNSSAPTPTSPTPAPILPANLVTPSGAVLNDISNCGARQQLAYGMGFATASCAFTGTLQNIGTGCAGNVRGTVTAYFDSAGTRQSGNAGIVYSGIVRPGEQIQYALLTTLAVPSYGAWYWRAAPAWDDVRCP